MGKNFRQFSVVLVVAILFFGCKKEHDGPKPSISFTVSGIDEPSVLMVVYDAAYLKMTATNIRSYLWEFGNGTTSKEPEPQLLYQKAGNYELTLTANGADGKKLVVKKNVRVVQPIITNASITHFDWSVRGYPGLNLPPRPNGLKANVWMEVVKGENNVWHKALPHGIFDGTLVYKSPIAKDVSLNAAPIVFEVSPAFNIDVAALHGIDLYYRGQGYAFNIYVQDLTGTYLLYSNCWSGFGTVRFGDVQKNEYFIKGSGSGAGFELRGGYQ